MTTEPMQVAIIGTGTSGSPPGCASRTWAHDVICCDVDAAQGRAMLQQGVVPIVEDGLAELIAEERSTPAGSRFVVGNDRGREGLPTMAFLCVPTPQGEDGSADLSYVGPRHARSTDPAPPAPSSSTSRPCRWASFKVVERHARPRRRPWCQQPRVPPRRDGVHDFLHPDRVVVGSDDRAGARWSQHSTTGPHPGVFTDPASAETHQVRGQRLPRDEDLSFINSVAAVCEHVGADVNDVVARHRHRPAHRWRVPQPGPGWGGSCFPKDSRALVSTAAQNGYDFSLMRGVIDINEQQYDRMVHKVMAAVGRDVSLDGIVVGALGLTFKAGTDDLRESPALRIVEALRARGATVQAYDPTAIGELNPVQRERLAGLHLKTAAVDAAQGADVTAVLTEWPEFRSLDLEKVASVMRGDAVVDCRNLLDGAAVRGAGLRYDGVGRS
jgi:UDPglucose 6-dehydrogenase